MATNTLIITILYFLDSTEIENLLKKKEFKNSKKKDSGEGFDEGIKHANIAVDIIEGTFIFYYKIRNCYDHI